MLLASKNTPASSKSASLRFPLDARLITLFCHQPMAKVFSADACTKAAQCVLVLRRMFYPHPLLRTSERERLFRKADFRLI